MTEKIFYTRQEIAADLNKSLRTVDRYLEKGFLKRSGKPGSHVRVYFQDYEEFLQKYRAGEF